MARTPTEIEPRAFEVGGVRVSHLSYTFSFNGLSLPDGEPWRSGLIDPDQVVADSAEARRRGAEVVIVSLHWGAEGVAAPTAWQREVADRLTAAGTIDLLVGHHAHVLQPIEQINGTWVVFGLGNILSNLPVNDSWPASSQDGAVVEVGFTVAPDGSVAVDRPVAHPTWVDKGSGWVVRPVLESLADPTTPTWLLAAVRTSLARTERVIADFLPLH